MKVPVLTLPQWAAKPCNCPSCLNTPSQVPRHSPNILHFNLQVAYLWYIYIYICILRYICKYTHTYIYISKSKSIFISKSIIYIHTCKCTHKHWWPTMGFTLAATQVPHTEKKPSEQTPRWRCLPSLHPCQRSSETVSYDPTHLNNVVV